MLGPPPPPPADETDDLPFDTDPLADNTQNMNQTMHNYATGGNQWWTEPVDMPPDDTGDTPAAAPAADRK